MRRQVSAHKQAQLARLLGLLFIVAGFVAIGLGWNGAAKRTCVDCQMPYLLSGGAAGLGLIVFGSTMLVVAQIRAERIRMGAYVDQIAQALRGGRSQARAVTGTGAASGADGDAAGAGDERVVAGTSTYHRPSCALVRGKDDLDLVAVADAVGRGLEPCRVCEPPDATSGSEAGGGAEVGEGAGVATTSEDAVAVESGGEDQRPAG